MSHAITVPLLDLKAQYATLRDEIEPVIRKVVEDQYFINGPEVQALEQETAAYLGARHAIGCASGSDAILLAAMALELGCGHGKGQAEVLMPSYTFFATAGSVARLGAKPVFVDIDPATYNMCPKATERAAAACTNLRAIMPVHLFGQAADTDAFLELGRRLGVPVIEDAAQAIGTRDATGAMAGVRGDFGCFSFFPSKNLGGFGDGGLVTTNDDAFAERVRRLAAHGSKPKYYHSIVGINSRLDALQAAVLRVKLRHLEAWHAGRAANAAFYDERFAAAGAKASDTPLSEGGLALRTPSPVSGQSRHVYNQYVIRVPAAIRDDLREHLKAQNIGTEIYYPVPLHRQECFANLGYAPGSLPESESAADETVALPIYAELSQDQLAHVAEQVVRFVESASPVSA